MFKLLFSPAGRLDRLKFFLSYAGVMLLFVSTAFGVDYLKNGGQSDGVENGTSMSIIQLFNYSIPLAAAFVVFLWVTACLIIKRSRDFSGTITFGLIFLFFNHFLRELLLAIDYTYVENVDFVFSILMFIAGMFLLFKPSKEEYQVENTSDVFE